jgi:hypothetical protein
MWPSFDNYSRYWRVVFGRRGLEHFRAIKEAETLDQAEGVLILI